MIKFKIEKNIPIPKEKIKIETLDGNVFNKLEVGDSFPFTIHQLKRVAQQASNYKRKTGKRYFVSVSYLRCWRVK